MIDKNNIILFSDLIKTYTLHTAPKKYIEQLYFNGEFFDSVDSIKLYCKRKSINMPETVFATKKVKFDFDLLYWLKTLLGDYEETEHVKCDIDLNKLSHAQHVMDDLLKDVYIYQKLDNIEINIREN